jgi:hypothetical protein
MPRRRIPAEQHAAVLDYTHGHPLELSLVVDAFEQRPDFHSQPEQTPDVVKMLLHLFVQKVPSPAHRAALEACVLVRLMTEPLLAEMLALPDPSINSSEGIHELYERLRNLSFKLALQGYSHTISRVMR